MKTIFFKKIKFVSLKVLLLTIIVVFLLIIISALINKKFLISGLFIILLLIFFVVAGKKVALIFLGKRILLYIKENSEGINVLQLESIFGYSKETTERLINKLSSDSLVKINEAGEIEITEKGIEKLKIWGE
jgi:hypothetical protein